MSRSFIIVSLLASVALVGCSTPRSSDLSSWQVCLIQPSLTETPTSFGPLTAGDAVQILYGSWTVPNKYATLSMEIPGALPKNRPTYVGGDRDEGDFKVRYQEGATMQTYDSFTVKGKVNVLSFTDRKAVLDIDLTVSNPVTDLDQVGEVVLKGEMEMQRVRGLNECYFRK
jgi:hypothetical protein